MTQNKNDAPVRLTILVNDPAHLRDLCGPHHSHLALIENAFGVRAESQGGGVEVQGDSGAAKLAEMALQNLADRLERGENVGAAEVRTEISRAQKGGGKPARILLPGRRGIVDALTISGYAPIEAADGQAGLEAASRPGIDLILLDVLLPKMDGFRVLESLRLRCSSVPVIMLTARAEVKDKLKALRIGVDDYLTKPFDEEELLVRIENLLKNQAARQEDIPNEAEAWEADLPIVSAADRDWLEAFEVCVQKNLSNDLFSIPMLAQEFMMSQSTLLRQLRRLTGLTPVQYLLEMRLNKARQLLEDRTYDSLAKVAAESGYSDLRSFSRSFRLRFGKLPSEV